MTDQVKAPEQGNLELAHTVKLEENLLPKEICVMITHTRRLYWTRNPEYNEHELHGFGGPSRYVERVEVQKWLELATFDEKSLQAHIKKWGVHTWDKPSYCGNGLKETFEQWLTYKKIPFQQLNGVLLYANDAPATDGFQIDR